MVVGCGLWVVGCGLCYSLKQRTRNERPRHGNPTLPPPVDPACRGSEAGNRCDRIGVMSGGSMREPLRSGFATLLG